MAKWTVVSAISTTVSSCKRRFGSSATYGGGSGKVRVQGISVTYGAAGIFASTNCSRLVFGNSSGGALSSALFGGPSTDHAITHNVSDPSGIVEAGFVELMTGIEGSTVGQPTQCFMWGDTV